MLTDGDHECPDRNWQGTLQSSHMPALTQKKSKVNRGNLEHYLLFCTSYSDVLCLMSENVLIHVVHLAQSQCSRQTWISLVLLDIQVMKLQPCRKMPERITWSTLGCAAMLNKGRSVIGRSSTNTEKCLHRRRHRWLYRICFVILHAYCT